MLLSEKEYSQSKLLTDRMGPEEAAVFVTELCRATDYFFISDAFLTDGRNKLGAPDLNIILRGWNPLIQRLQMKLGQTDGIALLESTNETVHAAAAELHRAGRSVLRRRERTATSPDPDYRSV